MHKIKDPIAELRFGEPPAISWPVDVGALCVVGPEAGVAVVVVVELGAASAGVALTSPALEQRLN